LSINMTLKLESFLKHLTLRERGTLVVLLGNKLVVGDAAHLMVAALYVCTSG